MGAAGERLKVLVVDDEYLVRLGLKTTIDWRRYGFEFVGEAEDGEVGLDCAAALRPDIIVTDMRMPFLDGIGFMEQLRSRGIRAKIVVLSGYDDFQYAKGAITYGASDYILKPVENDKLIAAVCKLADDIRRERLEERLGKQKLIVDLADRLRAIRNRRTACTHKLVEEAKRRIRSHYSEELTVARIAGMLYVSPSYLMHIWPAYRANWAEEL